MSFSETLFKLNIGVDTYNPDISEGLGLKLKTLKNIQPEMGRLKTPRGNILQQSIAGVTSQIASFAYYNVPTSQFTSLYALSTTSVFRFKFSSQLFETPAIYSGFPDSNDPYAKTPWLDAVYVTKRFGKLVKLQQSVATEIADAPGGRYSIIADGHLMLANVTSGTDEHPVRVQWSDLYAPESWVVAPSSESDFFELSPDDGESTGLSYQRGTTLVYTRDRIWTARYIKGDGDTILGKFQFDILFSGTGNIYHDALIRVKEVDYFIGADNFYKLDGFQLAEIGDEIWDKFQSTVAESNFQDSVIAIHEPQRYSIMWVYNHVDGYRWSVVYNYKENKWSERDPEDVYCNINLVFPVRGYIPWEEATMSWASMTAPDETWSGDWQFLDTIIRNLYGGSAGKVYIPSNPAAYVKADASAFDCELETFEFDFDELAEVKEVNRLKLLFSKRDGDEAADSDLAIRIGTRARREDDVVWSDPLELVDMLAVDSVFYFRSKGVGKLMRFKFNWTNNSDYAISEIVKMSIYKLNQDDGNETPEK